MNVVKCAKCGAAVFPGAICLKCYEQAEGAKRPKPGTGIKPFEQIDATIQLLGA